MKNRRNLTFWILLVAFALFSAAAGFKLLYGVDQWTLHASQTWTTNEFDRIGGVFSILGTVELTLPALVALVVWLFLTNNRTLALRLSIAVFATSLVELAMKMWLPQLPMPEETSRAEDYSPIVDVPYAYPYPSGHMLRSVLLFGAIYLLWQNSVGRVLILLVLGGMAVTRVYMGVHWPSDVIGGALLGLAGLAWVFRKRSAISNQPSAVSDQPKTVHRKTREI